MLPAADGLHWRAIHSVLLADDLFGGASPTVSDSDSGDDKTNVKEEASSKKRKLSGSSAKKKSKEKKSKKSKIVESSDDEDSGSEKVRAGAQTHLPVLCALSHMALVRV